MKYRSIDKSVDREDFIFNGKTVFPSVDGKSMGNPGTFRRIGVFILATRRLGGGRLASVETLFRLSQ